MGIPTVILLDGPIGVGKTTLGRLAASRLDFAFIDGDDLSGGGDWLSTTRRTSHRIAQACSSALKHSPGVIVAYPVRWITWRFYSLRFSRQGIACHCIGLTASSANIERRARLLDPAERARSRQMILQGYGTRPFNTAQIRTDAAGLDQTTDSLTSAIRDILARPSQPQAAMTDGTGAAP